jgi:hypothetical protein
MAPLKTQPTMMLYLNASIAPFFNTVHLKVTLKNVSIVLLLEVRGHPRVTDVIQACTKSERKIKVNLISVINAQTVNTAQNKMLTVVDFARMVTLPIQSHHLTK